MNSILLASVAVSLISSSAPVVEHVSVSKENKISTLSINKKGE